jgi:hypothetical protein
MDVPNRNQQAMLNQLTSATNFAYQQTWILKNNHKRIKFKSINIEKKVETKYFGGCLNYP